jgi:hypothetical protein
LIAAAADDTSRVEVDRLSSSGEAPIPFTHRYVVTSASAGSAWRGHVAISLRKPLLPIEIGACVLLAAFVWYDGLGPHHSSGTRAVLAVAGGVMTAIVIWTPLFALGYWVTKRNRRYRFYEGAVLESGFGVDALVTRNPSVARRIRYDAVKSIDVRGDRVYVRVLGDVMSLTWPRALFPDEEISRIRAAGRNSNLRRDR